MGTFCRARPSTATLAYCGSFDGLSHAHPRLQEHRDFRPSRTSGHSEMRGYDYFQFSGQKASSRTGAEVSHDRAALTPFGVIGGVRAISSSTSAAAGSTINPAHYNVCTPVGTPSGTSPRVTFSSRRPRRSL